MMKNFSSSVHREDMGNNWLIIVGYIDIIERLENLVEIRLREWYSLVEINRGT